MAASGHVVPASTRRDLAAHLTGNTAQLSIAFKGLRIFPFFDFHQ